MPTITLTINHEAGLHLRPGSLFVQTAGKFASDITVTHGERSANAKSMLSIMTLGVKQGSVVTVSAEGDDAQEALDALKELVESNFGE
jgi:phosphocarrier protein HPr